MKNELRYDTEQELQTTDKTVKRCNKAEDFTEIEGEDEESYYMFPDFIWHERVLENGWKRPQ